MLCLRSSTSSVRAAAPRRASSVAVRAYKVELKHKGSVQVLEVPEGESILSVALDKGLDLPHDCKLGVCMTCPAKLVRLGALGWDCVCVQ